MMKQKSTPSSKAGIAITVCLTLSLFLIKPSVANELDKHPLCQQHKNSLWKITQQGETSIISSMNTENTTPTTMTSNSYETVNLNNDNIEDLHLSLGGCGSGGCMSTWVIGCGGNLYYPVVAPEYNERLTVDKANSVKKNEVTWQDLTYTTWEGSLTQQEEDLTQHWRMQFDGVKYSKSFLLSEYKALIKKAKQGNQFASYQLATTAYPQLKKDPENPKFKSIKSELTSISFLKTLIKKTNINIGLLPKAAAKDKNLLILLHKNNPSISAEHLDEILLDDDDIARQFLSGESNNLQYFSDRIKSNKKMVEIALNKNPYSLAYASMDIRSNKKIMIEWSKAYGIGGKSIADHLKSDIELATIFIKNNEESYKDFNDALKKNKALARLAFKDRGLIMRFAPTEIQQDKELLALAAKNDARILARIPNHFANDKEFSLLLACQNPGTYRYFSPSMLADEKIAFIATINNSGMLRFVPEKLKENRGFILSIVRTNPYIYRNISPELRADTEIAKTVFKQIKSQWSHAPKIIKDNVTIQNMIKKTPKNSEAIRLEKLNTLTVKLCPPNVL